MLYTYTIWLEKPNFWKQISINKFFALKKVTKDYI